MDKAETARALVVASHLLAAAAHLVQMEQQNWEALVERARELAAFAQEMQPED